jgi:hypothetical protein
VEQLTVTHRQIPGFTQKYKTRKREENGLTYHTREPVTVKISLKPLITSVKVIKLLSSSLTVLN